MKSLTKIGVAIFPLYLLTACANTVEIDALKVSLQEVQSLVNTALSTARNAQRSADIATDTANEAKIIAYTAQKAANSSLNSVDKSCTKIDSMFRKSINK